ncbi:MAG: ribonuclease HIII [Candidatus Aenigmarchaeota archaeon]|nr:ribonuclease HIII [Candidatus Aenigmarchaeota archaeon]
MDEAGKGDYFGYLVVAAVLVGDETEKKLLAMGVKDSKKLSDYAVKSLGPKIAKLCPTEIVKISPEKYNKIYPRFASLNNMLAWGHSRVIENLVAKTGCNDVITDRFAEESLLKEYLMPAGKKANVEQRIHGEADTAVAAASVVARCDFLRTLRLLGREVGFVLPKGSTNVKTVAKEIIAMHGKDVLPMVAKMHFRITREIGVSL